MKKLLTLIAFVSFLGIFSACEEEEITPQNNTTVENQGQGSGSDDPGQWD